MTRDEAAVERMARARYEAFCREPPNDEDAPIPWDDLDDQQRRHWLDDEGCALRALNAGPLPRAVMRRAIEELKNITEPMQKAGFLANTFENRQPDGTPGCPGVKCPVDLPRDWEDPANVDAIRAYLAAPRCLIAKLTLPADKPFLAMLDAKLAELDAEARDG